MIFIIVYRYVLRIIELIIVLIINLLIIYIEDKMIKLMEELLNCVIEIDRKYILYIYDRFVEDINLYGNYYLCSEIE